MITAKNSQGNVTVGNFGAESYRRERKSGEIHQNRVMVGSLENKIPRGWAFFLLELIGEAFFWASIG